jgi:hypothetical protein
MWKYGSIWHVVKIIVDSVLKIKMNLFVLNSFLFFFCVPGEKSIVLVLFCNHSFDNWFWLSVRLWADKVNLLYGVSVCMIAILFTFMLCMIFYFVLLFLVRLNLYAVDLWFISLVLYDRFVRDIMFCDVDFWLVAWYGEKVFVYLTLPGAMRQNWVLATCNVLSFGKLSQAATSLEMLVSFTLGSLSR